jgi:hypothetical protein
MATRPSSSRGILMSQPAGGTMPPCRASPARHADLRPRRDDRDHHHPSQGRSRYVGMRLGVWKRFATKWAIRQNAYHRIVLLDTGPALGEGPAELIFLTPTRPPSRMGFATWWQTRYRFGFAETKPQTGTPQKTLKKPACVRHQCVCRSPLREPLKLRFCGESEPPSNRRCEGLAKTMAHFVANRCHTPNWVVGIAVRS